MRVASLISAIFLTACVTINIYFPAAAAEKVADEIIKGIQTEETTLNKKVAPKSKKDAIELITYQWIDVVLELLIPSVQAAAADLSVNTSEIRQLRAAMHNRFPALKAFYGKGLIAIKADGYIGIRGSVPLKERNKVNKLVAAENADRQRLYQAIANANGHPEWFEQIQSTFAIRWVGNALSGWWFQTSKGNWKQK